MVEKNFDSLENLTLEELRLLRLELIFALIEKKKESSAIDSTKMGLSGDESEELFWCLYEIWQNDLSSEGVEVWILDPLARLEADTRVPYEPDEDGIEKISELLTYAYIATAYGLALRRIETGYSEEAHRVFMEAGKAYGRIYSQVEGMDTVPAWDSPEVDTFHDETALMSLPALNLFQVAVAKDDLKDALHFFSLSIRNYTGLIDAERDGYPSYTGRKYSELLGPCYEFIPKEIHQKAVNVFEHARFSHSVGTDWRELLRYVSLIAGNWPYDDTGAPDGVQIIVERDHRKDQV